MWLHGPGPGVCFYHIQVCEIINLHEFYSMHKCQYRDKLMAYQVISKKVASLDKGNAEVVGCYAIFIVQKKTPQYLLLEGTQEGLVEADDLEPEKPHYQYCANLSRRPPVVHVK